MIDGRTGLAYPSRLRSTRTATGYIACRDTKRRDPHEPDAPGTRFGGARPTEPPGPAEPSVGTASGCTDTPATADATSRPAVPRTRDPSAERDHQEHRPGDEQDRHAGGLSTREYPVGRVPEPGAGGADRGGHRGVGEFDLHRVGLATELSADPDAVVAGVPREEARERREDERFGRAPLDASDRHAAHEEDDAVIESGVCTDDDTPTRDHRADHAGDEGSRLPTRATGRDVGGHSRTATLAVRERMLLARLKTVSPITNLFLTERAAHQLYPDVFGDAAGGEELFDRQRVADVVAGDG